MPDLATKLWVILPAAFLVVSILLSVVTSVHAILHKRDPRAAVSWTGLIWLVPIGGALLYVIFGVNRIARRAGKLRQRRRPMERIASPTICTEDELLSALGPEFAHLAAIAKVADKLTGRKLLEGNKVDMLVNGEQAYPAMLKAIRDAKGSVALQAYIFENDAVGRQFIEALIDAKKRGLSVRVLADYVGSHRSVANALDAADIKVDLFLPPRFTLFRNRFMNLRNHRKILICDGRLGFTGGMNIRQSHLVDTPGPHHEQDTHFRIEGPTVSHLMEAFADDWAFVTEEKLAGEQWFPAIPADGTVNARGVAFDPGEEDDLLRFVVGASIAAARNSIRIVSPYFIPEQPVITALNVAALRGVQVDILIPVKNDSRLVQWAMQAMLWQVLINGCRVWYTPEPFDHSKLIVIDDAWVFFGSANMDTRSMRLNFEFNVESYDRNLAKTVVAHIEGKLKRARAVTMKEVDGRPLGIKLRDGIARLWSPYL